MSTKLKPEAATDVRTHLLAGLPVRERRLTLAGVSTAVLEGGEGQPVLLLHGPGAYGASWLRIIPELSASQRVIAPDLPGHGASNGFDGPADAGRTLSWLGELIERTCQRPPVIVGQLVGGAIAARFAADHGEKLERLVLVVPLGLAPFQPTPAFGSALTGFLSEPNERTHDELWQECVFDLDAVRRQTDARWELIKAYNLDRARSSDVTAAVQQLIEQFCLAAIPDSVLSRIAVPTSLIWGRYDSVVPLSVGESASARYGWPLSVLEDAGNEPAIEAPHAFLRALRIALGPASRVEAAS